MIYEIDPLLLYRWTRFKEKIECYLKCPYYTIRHLWYFTWIRKDEFHKSLDIDVEYVLYRKISIKEHYESIAQRREIAHNRGIQND